MPRSSLKLKKDLGNAQFINAKKIKKMRKNNFYTLK